MFKHFVLISIFLITLSTFATAFPGDLDTFFGTGGIATVNAGRDSFDQAFAAALQPDGKTVIVGDSLPSSLQFGDEPASFIVSRINVDGSLDTTFGAHGFTSKRLALSLSRATSVAIQADGKIVVGGYTIKTYPVGNKRVFMLIRLNQNGTIDTTYGTNGFVTMDLPDFTQASLNALAIQADGKVVAAGYSYVGASGSPQSFAAARFNTDGSLDTGFDGDGKVFVDVNPSGNRGNAIAIQTDGKIVIGGLVRETSSSVTDFGLVRLNADGSLDSGFDGDGKLTTKFATATTNVLGLRIRSDGKIVAAGNSTLGSVRDIAVARYNTDGSLDTSFDGDGRVTSNFGDETVGGISLQSDGKILVSGRVSLSGELFNLLTVRYNTDGSLDNTFDTDGKIITPVPDLVSFANAVMVRPDGKIVLGGTTGTFLRSDFVFARYNADGSPDPSFDTDGISVVAPPNASDLIQDMALQPDGKIVTAGTGFGGFYLEGALARFLPDGSLDTSFGNQGTLSISLPDVDVYIPEVLAQPDGKILVCVAAYMDGRFTTMRFNANGSPDNSYGTAGVSTVQVGTVADYLSAMLLLPDGKIIVVGNSDGKSTGRSLVKLKADGTLDTTFGTGGIVINNFSDPSSFASAAALQSDGKIVIAGGGNLSGSSSFFLARFNANGTVDTDFGTSGSVHTTFTANVGGARSMAIQRDGKIVVAGESSSNTALARYNPNGSLDNSFDGDGKLITSPDGNVFYAMNDVVVQPNGKIVLAGSAAQIVSEDPDHDLAVFRLNSDGSFDPSFGNGGKAITPFGESDAMFYAVLLKPDGRILAGGYSSNGANNDFTVARYRGDTRAGFDYDGDGRSDVSVFRPSGGDWYLLNSTTGYTGFHFGAAGDLLAPADLDCDGKTDVAVFRASVGGWYWLNSSNGNFSAMTFGQTGDLPTPADYDGDGRADISVYRPSTGDWYRMNSSNGQFVAVHFGSSGDKPALGDFDGDGKADISIFRPSDGNWYRLNSSTGEYVGIHFGVAEDKPTPADYDGDGKTDISVYRPSVGDWFRLNSSTGEFAATHFGNSTDKPAAADFDGDGKADITVFRPSDGNWYELNTTAGFAAVHFGVSEDMPTSNAFVY